MKTTFTLLALLFALTLYVLLRLAPWVVAAVMLGLFWAATVVKSLVIALLALWRRE